MLFRSPFLAVTHLVDHTSPLMPEPPPVRGLLQGCKSTFSAAHHLGISQPRTAPSPTEYHPGFFTTYPNVYGPQGSPPIPSMKDAIAAFRLSLAAMLEANPDPDATKDLLRVTAHALNNTSRLAFQDKSKVGSH